MADSDKNIRITTNKNKATLKPNIVFTGASAGTSVLTLEVRDDNTVAFTGIDGDVFSLDYNLSTGTIWSVNDKSGTPFLRASAGGTIGIAELGSNVIVGIGQTNPKYKLDVQGWVGFASTGDGSYTVLVENGSATGNNALSIRAANALRFYNSNNSLYTGFIGSQSGVNTSYTLPRTSPATGTSVLQSDTGGVMTWVPMVAGSSSGTVNSGTANYAAYYATSTTAVTQNANLQFTGTGISVGGTINSSSTTTGSLYVVGGVGITGNAFIGGTVYVPSTTPSNFSNLLISNNTSSTSTSSGALVVNGGIGLVGNAFIGGTINIASTTPSIISNLLVSNNTVSTSASSGALIVAGGVGIGGSLYTGTGFSSSISGVILAGGNVAATTYNKLTLSTPANAATLTLANNSTLATSGAFSLTLTTTAASNVTFPTAGTLTSTGNNLGVFASTSSSQLIGIMSDATGTTKLVFSTSPTFTTSVVTDSASFNVFNTVATTVNAFQAGTAISVGAATGTLTLNNATTLINQTTASTTSSTGALVVSGGAGIAKSVSIGGYLQLFNGANYTSFVSASIANTVYTLPSTSPAAIGTSVLSSTTAGVMSWVPLTTGGSASPGGSNTQIQYNNGSSFGGATGLTWNNGSNLLTVSATSTLATSGTEVGLRIINGNYTDSGTNTRWSPAFELIGRAASAGPGFATTYNTRFTTEVVPLGPANFSAYLRTKYSFDLVTASPSYTNDIFRIHSTLGVGVGASNSASNAISYFRVSTSQSGDVSYTLPPLPPKRTSITSNDNVAGYQMLGLQKCETLCSMKGFPKLTCHQ
jgi:hypothetical protein